MSTTFFTGFATGDQSSDTAGPMKLKKRFEGIAGPVHPALTAHAEEGHDPKPYRRALRAAEMAVWEKEPTATPRATVPHRRHEPRRRLKEDADKWLFVFLTLCAAIVLRSLT
jgi:hypothetical protein